MGKIYIVGVGLVPKQITLEALEIIKSCDIVFVDTYTSMYAEGDFKELERIINKPINYLKRKDIEVNKVIVDKAKSGFNVALLVVGDPHIATTHTALIEEALNQGLDIEFIPGISILCASMTYTGLMPYRFGKPVSLVFPKNGILYTSTYDVIEQNRKLNLHTFLFLDLDVERGIYMTISDAASLLLKLEEVCRRNVITEDMKVIGIARAGSRSSCIVYESLGTLRYLNLGPPPHSLIIPAPKLHPIEEQTLTYVVNKYRSCVRFSR